MQSAHNLSVIDGAIDAACKEWGAALRRAQQTDAVPKQAEQTWRVEERPGSVFPSLPVESAAAAGDASKDLRVALRDAQTKRAVAMSRLNAARTAAERAQSIVEDATLHLSRYDNVEHAITQYRAGLIKKWSKKSSGPPPAMDVPPELAAQRAERAEAADRLAAAEAAHASLAAELDQARQEFDAADERVFTAALAVVYAEAQAEGREFKRLQQRVWQLRDKLFGAVDMMMRLRGSGRIHRLEFSTEVLRNTLVAQEPQRAGNVNPVGAHERAWHAYVKRLVDDPAAVIEDDARGSAGVSDELSVAS